MTKINPNININDDFDLDTLHSRHKVAPTSRFKQAPRSGHAVSDEILRYAGLQTIADEEAFSPTYHGSRFEREWILTYLGNFYDQHLLTDVLRRVKGGKEANVYCCQADPATGLDLLAAKLYRPRMLRNLRNDARYRQGRDYLDEYGKVIREHGMLRDSHNDSSDLRGRDHLNPHGKAMRDSGLMVAIRKGTTVGKESAHTSWIEHEYRALDVLRAAGCSVPRPVAIGENTILMEYIGDLDCPAPTLHEVRLSVRQARRIYDSLLEDLKKMLAAGRVHGDLSAYNVLYWQDEARIIDLPQVVDPRQNPDAWDIFQRDVTRLCQYFQRYGLGRNPARLASDLWDRHAYPRGPEEPDPVEEE